MWVLCDGLHSHQISTRWNTYGRIWRSVRLRSPPQSSKPPNEGIYFGRFPETWRIIAKVYWSRFGGSWRPDTLCCSHFNGMDKIFGTPLSLVLYSSSTSWIQDSFCLPCVWWIHRTRRKTHQDPGKLLLFHPSGSCLQRSPSSLLLSDASLSLSLWAGLVCPNQSLKIFAGVVRSSVFTPSRHSLCLRPSYASSGLFWSAAGVASLLCVNSALSRNFFYAVKRTCDRQRGVEGGEEGREGGGVWRKHFLDTCPLRHSLNNSSVSLDKSKTNK